MSADAPNLPSLNLAGLRLAVVASCFNQNMVDSLLAQVLKIWGDYGLSPESVLTERVPGSGEIPSALALLLRRHSVHAALGLGVIIRGATKHYELLAEHTGSALQTLCLQTGVPVINGIVVAETKEQAEERCSGPIPRGREFAEATLWMADLHRRYAD